MFRATRRSVSERGRYSSRLKLAVVFSLIAILCSGLSFAHSQVLMHGPFDPVVGSIFVNNAITGTTGITRSHQQIGYVDVRLVQTRDRAEPSFVDGTNSFSSTHMLLRVELRWSHFANPRSYRRVMGRYLAMNRFVIETVSMRPLFGKEETLDLMERHWGPDWAMNPPDALLDLLDAQQVDRFRNYSYTMPAGVRVRSTLAGEGRLIIESLYPWQPHAMKWTLWLWGLTGVGYAVFTFVSRDHKARRWLAGKCPKCGYPRSSIREDCAECGLRYERPSHVTWDPKNGKVEM